MLTQVHTLIYTRHTFTKYSILSAESSRTYKLSEENIPENNLLPASKIKIHSSTKKRDTEPKVTD